MSSRTCKMAACRHVTALLAVLLTALVAHSAAGSAPTVPVILHDQNFEHQTQASTGQTTGIWCVLFTAARSSDSHADAMRLWARLASDEDKEVIYALVDLDSNKQLAQRFNAVNIPSAVLLRDRAMYVMNVPHDEDSAEIISAFVSGGYSQLPRQQVPAPGSGTAASSNEGLDTATANKLKVAFILFAIAAVWKFALYYQSWKAKQAAAQSTPEEPTKAETKSAKDELKAAAKPKKVSKGKGE